MLKIEAVGPLRTAASSRTRELLAGINHAALEQAKHLFVQANLAAANQVAELDGADLVLATRGEVHGRRCDCGCDRGRANFIMSARIAAA